MSFWTQYYPIILISIGLAMDAFAVSITNGITIECLKLRNAVRIALFFGGFQALMPLLGWLAGIGLKQYVQAFDHWIAFALLGFIGAKMIYEAIWIQEVEKKCDPLNLIVLLGLAIATSIDALAVGITFACLKIAIVTPALIIGCVTFLLCLAGVFIGNRMGDRLGSKMEVLGGIILIGMGLKILLQHLGVI
ncbi:MAG TPA: manganese efflux pump MntP family protein [Candidatus Cloacimonadota bacterium]|nr:manganese efflux pump MntP family protein [Candidatus Cloacimonadota bacterium]HPS39147.1 manganese efflux pump MntP family protein [Candidatus Cloacimonadota bacterium]